MDLNGALQADFMVTRSRSEFFVLNWSVEGTACYVSQISMCKGVLGVETSVGPCWGWIWLDLIGPVSMWTALDYAFVAPCSPVQAQRRAMRDREKFEFHQNHAVGVSSDWFGLGLPHMPGWKEWELLQQAHKIPWPNYRSVLFIEFHIYIYMYR